MRVPAGHEESPCRREARDARGVHAPGAHARVAAGWQAQDRGLHPAGLCARCSCLWVVLFPGVAGWVVPCLHDMSHLSLAAWWEGGPTAPQQPPPTSTPFGWPPSCPLQAWWEESIALLNDFRFLDSLLEFDKDALPQEVADQVSCGKE